MYEDNTEGERMLIGLSLMVMGVALLAYIGWGVGLIAGFW